MKLIFHILFFVLTASNASLYTDIKGSVSSYLKTSLNNLKESLRTKVPNRFEIKHNEIKRKEIKQNDMYRPPTDLQKVNQNNLDFERNKIIKLNERSLLRNRDTKPSESGQFHLDPVLNFVKRREANTRRKHDDVSDSSSSSLEMENWKDEWREKWIKKKLEALNDTNPRGDIVNMVAARPWGVPCGDPDQHDMPWGTCTLAMECDAEYRIYRGDYFCGRTTFACCAIQLTDYDMYQGFDISFEDSNLSTSSEEIRNRGKGPNEKNKRRKRRERERRRKARRRRKRKIKKNIRKIIKEIRKILNRSYRNGTSERKKKTKQLKKFIKELKKKYQKDRKSVKEIHEIELVKIDSRLMKRLNQIKSMNHNFITNSTFRDIVVNGTITRQGARMLVQAYPELITYFTPKKTRRVGDPKDYLDYDIEYGMLYY